MALFHTSSSLLAYGKRADGVFAELQLADEKKKGIQQTRAPNNTLLETNSRDSLCFSSLCFFFPCSVEDSVQTLITRRSDTLAVSMEYKAEAGLKKELSLLFQSTPL